jgi:WD40 repeat protein
MAKKTPYTRPFSSISSQTKNQPHQTLSKQHSEPIFQILLSTDKTHLFTASKDGTIMVLTWPECVFQHKIIIPSPVIQDTDNAEIMNPNLFELDENNSDKMTCICTSPTTHLLAVSSLQKIYIYDQNTFQLVVPKLSTTIDHVSVLQFNLPGNLLAIANEFGDLTIHRVGKFFFPVLFQCKALHSLHPIHGIVFVDENGIDHDNDDNNGAQNNHYLCSFSGRDKTINRINLKNGEVLDCKPFNLTMLGEEMTFMTSTLYHGVLVSTNKGSILQWNNSVSHIVNTMEKTHHGCSISTISAIDDFFITMGDDLQCCVWTFPLQIMTCLSYSIPSKATTVFLCFNNNRWWIVMGDDRGIVHLWVDG